MCAHKHGERVCRELLSVSLLWVSEPTDRWVLFRSKKLVGGSGILGSGDREGKKGAQEGGISQNGLRKWKKEEGSLTSRSGRRKGSRKAPLLCLSGSWGAIEVTMAFPLPDAASQDQGEL